VGFQKLDVAKKKRFLTFIFYKGSTKHGGRTRSLFVFGWIFGVPLDNYDLEI
jgi:hypothetical protein